jgi:hypothetical protein
MSGYGRNSLMRASRVASIKAVIAAGLMADADDVITAVVIPGESG